MFSILLLILVVDLIPLVKLKCQIDVGDLIFAFSKISAKMLYGLHFALVLY